MGEKLRIRGRGLDAGLRGELHITSPGGRLSRRRHAARGRTAPTRRTDRSSASTAACSPSPARSRTRVSTSRRPGRTSTSGSASWSPARALNPRVRLFSEPEHVGHRQAELARCSAAPATTTGGTDTALLQRAALALLAGEGTGPTDQFTQAIGLDEISVRQQTDGDIRETIVKVGKQLSKRWYVGYERGLNATAGSWQLIYRLARRSRCGRRPAATTRST